MLCVQFSHERSDTHTTHAYTQEGHTERRSKGRSSRLYVEK